MNSGQAGSPPGLEVTQPELLADMKKALDGALAQAATDPFGFGFPWATWDTTSHGAGLSVIESFSTVEPAVHLTATSPLAFARQAAGLL